MTILYVFPRLNMQMGKAVSQTLQSGNQSLPMLYAVSQKKLIFYRRIEFTEVKMACSKSSTESEQNGMKPLSSKASGIIYNSVNYNAHTTCRRIATYFIRTISFILSSFSINDHIQTTACMEILLLAYVCD